MHPDVQFFLWSVVQPFRQTALRHTWGLPIKAVRPSCSKPSRNRSHTSILCGESHLNDTLRKPVHEALRQRITVHYNYSGLSDEEVSKYILHKIQLAGASSTIIDPAALAAAHSFAQDNPRLIDNLMTDALTIGAQQDKKVIPASNLR